MLRDEGGMLIRFWRARLLARPVSEGWNSFLGQHVGLALEFCDFPGICFAFDKATSPDISPGTV